MASTEHDGGDYRCWSQIDYQPLVKDLPPSPLLAVMRPGQRVLEIGCGAGYSLAHLAKIGLEVEGWDINASVLETARKCVDDAGVGRSITLVAGDFLKCPSLPRQADAVALTRVLTCLPKLSDWCMFLARAKQCVKVGGYFYVRDFLVSADTYAARYERGRSMGWRYGAFAVPEGKSPPEFIAYHHTQGDIDEICRSLVVISLKREEGRSLSGNRVQTFELLARKPRVERAGVWGR